MIKYFKVLCVFPLPYFVGRTLVDVYDKAKRGHVTCIVENEHRPKRSFLKCNIKCTHLRGCSEAVTKNYVSYVNFHLDQRSYCLLVQWCNTVCHLLTQIKFRAVATKSQFNSRTENDSLKKSNNGRRMSKSAASRRSRIIMFSLKVKNVFCPILLI